MEKRMCGCGMRPKSKEERNAELRKDAARIVAGVENYSGADRMKRSADVKAAFPPVKTASAKTASRTIAKTSSGTAAKAAVKTTRSAAKPTTAKATAKTTVKAASKGPTPAGMSVGPHDGDLC